MSVLFETIPLFFGLLPEIVSALLSLVGAASAAAALTPSPKDDRWLAKAHRVLQCIALNIGHAGEKPRK